MTMKIPRAAAVIAAIVVVKLSVAASAVDTFPAEGGDIEIVPIVHASVQVEHAGTVIHVDPWSLGDLSGAKQADLILISDDPTHHLDLAAIRYLRKPGAPVVMPASGRTQIPDGIVLSNGQSTTVAGVQVESVAAYDIKPGEPSHPKGEANGYVVTLGGKRLYFAGVTECVPEIRALRNIDIAFIPMNLPLGRMSPVAAGDCVKAFLPKIVYVYHYDNASAARIAQFQPFAVAQAVVDSLAEFEAALKGHPVEVRHQDWYPSK